MAKSAATDASGRRFKRRIFTHRMNIDYLSLAARMLRLRRNWQIMFSVGRNAQHDPAARFADDAGQVSQPGHLWVLVKAWRSVERGADHPGRHCCVWRSRCSIRFGRGEGDRSLTWWRDAPRGSPGGDDTDPDAAPARYGAAVPIPAITKLSRDQKIQMVVQERQGAAKERNRRPASVATCYV